MNGTELIQNIVVPLAVLLGLYWSLSDSTRRSGFKSTNAIFALAVIILGTLMESGTVSFTFSSMIGGIPMLGQVLGGIIDGLWNMVFPIFRAFYLSGAVVAWVELLWGKVMFPAIVSLPLIGEPIKNAADYLSGKR